MEPTERAHRSSSDAPSGPREAAEAGAPVEAEVGRSAPVAAPGAAAEASATPNASDAPASHAASQATHGIGSHTVPAPAATGEDATTPGGVLIHRPGYPARRLEPIPGVGVERPHLPDDAFQREATDRLLVWALQPSGEGEETHDLARLRELVAEPGTRVWVDLTDPTYALVAEVAHVLGIHPLVAEDIVERGQRPKVELAGEGAHIVVYALAYGDHLTTSEIDIVLGREYILTSHEPQWDPTETHHLRLGPLPLLARGPDYLAWALIDSLVDSYYPIFDGIDGEIDTLEDEILATADKRSLSRLLEVKRSLVEIRHVVSPMREVFNQLTNRELAIVQPETILYFRDVYDHLIRLNDELDSYREVASGILDVYLSTINNNLSLIMKRLTGVTVILAGVGAVGGIFGMSEASAALSGGEHSGFWLITVLVVIGASITAFILHRIDWI
jgi:magnesium transporter